ncbi:MAG TPA: choice-of-anchor P family protein [Candidatus Krumholzibacteria bacterium]|nr:choice-of-anchor P family protein [Candidatus Krumholzibacteria bacterium]
MSHIAHKSVLLTGALLLVSVASASAQVTYSGRAIAARLSAPAMTTQTAGDTGELPPAGGFLTADVFNVSLNLNDETFTAASVTDTTSGVNDETYSASHLNTVKFTLNQDGEVVIRICGINSSATASCNGMSATSEVECLWIGDECPVVTGVPNQVIDIPGKGTLVLNEQIATSTDITVNAAHLTLNDGTELILGTSRAGVAGCDVVPVQSTSWGHVKSLYR